MFRRPQRRLSANFCLLATAGILASSYIANCMHPATSSELETRQWAMFLHLSLLAGLLVPGAGFVLPIVLWQIKKDELPGIDAHGKVVANWLISALIYGVASGILCFLLVGIPLLAILGLLSLIFPIIGGIKANEGIVWKYPLSIRFFE